jgi:alpha-ribazole phosphatase
MNLYLVRHTRVDVPQGFCYGFTDVPLAETFIAESNEVITKLKGITFNAIYSSPLTRCVQLANRIANGKEINFDERLKEMSFGSWEGKLWDDIYPTTEAKGFFDDFVRNPASNGECFSDVISRVKSFIDEILSKSGHNDVLIVTHGGSIRAFYSIINGTNPASIFDLQVDYGEVVVLNI